MSSDQSADQAAIKALAQAQFAPAAQAYVTSVTHAHGADDFVASLDGQAAAQQALGLDGRTVGIGRAGVERVDVGCMAGCLREVVRRARCLVAAVRRRRARPHDARESVPCHVLGLSKEAGNYIMLRRGKRLSYL